MRVPTCPTRDQDPTRDQNARATKGRLPGGATKAARRGPVISPRARDQSAGCRLGDLGRARLLHNAVRISHAAQVHELVCRDLRAPFGQDQCGEIPHTAPAPISLGVVNLTIFHRNHHQPTTISTRRATVTTIQNCRSLICSPDPPPAFRTRRRRAPTNWFGGKAIGRHRAAVFPSCSPNSSAATCSRSCIFSPSH